MFTKDLHSQKNAHNGAGTMPPSTSVPAPKRARASRKVTEARASAQRTKLDAQAEARVKAAEGPTRARPPAGKRERGQPGKAGKRGAATVESAIADYLLDHAGGNHSAKTLEWHCTALGLLQTYLADECQITLVEDIDAPELNGWLAHLRITPGSRGKPRAERSSQTYARSARAFFHWLVRRETIARNPFDRVTFPKVGKPLIQTIDADEFERLLLACTPPHESGPFSDRAAVRNRAILWVLYDTGIRVSELCGLRLGDFDRKHGVLTVMRNLLYYLDRYRPDEDELAEWGSAEEDHLFLSEMRLPLTKNGVTLLFKRIQQRAGITGKRISPHIFRHSFAIRYLVLGNDPFSLQELLGHEDMTTVKNYMHMNDETIQSQKRKYSPGDHLPSRMPGPRETRRRGYRVRRPVQRRREK